MPYAQSSHLGFIGVGGEHSTYIISFEALCSQQPFRVYWGGGGNILLTSSVLRLYARPVVAIFGAETACFHRLPLVKDFTNITNTTSLCFDWILLLKTNVSTSRVVAIFGV